MTTTPSVIPHPYHPLDFLLHFVNVKTWSKEELFVISANYWLITTMAGEKNGYETHIRSRKFDSGWFRIFGEATELLPLSFENTEEEFFHVLVELQAYWQNLLEQVREHGQDIKFLNEIAARAEWSIEETPNPFAPKLGNFHFRASTIEDWLEFRYLDAATYYGDDFKRLRTCANPACGKKFLFNRPKQKFCRDACRHHFNNRIKIESGYLARHQKKGREEKPEIYLLK